MALLYLHVYTLIFFSDLRKSTPSVELEPSFTETLSTSQNEQTVTQSEVTTTVAMATSSTEGLGGQNSVVEPQKLMESVDKPEDNDLTSTENTVKSEETTENTTHIEFKDTEDTSTPKPTPESVDMTKEPPVQLPEPGAGGAAIVTETDTKDEEGLTFNEWTQKVLAEAEKGKLAQEDTENTPLPPLKQRKRKNYAAQDCGAKILTSNPEATNAKSVLNSNKDEYMINPCKAKKWFVIELCEPIQAHSVEIASLELFSSLPKKFRIFLSDRYPTKDWKLGGEFLMKDERIIQSNEITETQEYFAKYVRVELIDHYGDEHFCPLTMFRVLGVAVVDYEDDHHGNEDGDDDDDDDNTDNDNEEKSQNLFTSAKDTVMNIVKKVLNVESDMAELNMNVSQSNITHNGTTDGVNNVTTSEDTLPCMPEANIPNGEGKKTACNEGTKSTDTQPQVPEPGKANSVIVVKLEDDEQLETSDTLTENIPLLEHLKTCYNRLDEAYKSLTSQKCFRSDLCVFTFMVYQLCHPEIPNNETLDRKTVKIPNSVRVQETDVDIQKDLDTTAKQDEEIKLSKDSSEVSKSSIQSASVREHNTSIEKTTEVKKEPEVTVDSVKSVVDKSEDIRATQTEKVNQSPEPTKSSTVASSNIEVTQSISSPSQTGSKISQSDSGLVTDSVFIDPSPSIGLSHGSETQSTPSLSENWEPHTKDLAQDEDLTTGQKTQIPSDASKGTPGVSPVAPNSPEVPSVTIVSEPTVALETSDALIGDEEDMGFEETLETTEQKSNTTIIDDKVVVSNGGSRKKDDSLNLVRLPVLSGGKRESAIMRLSNRIKVLEQNVSLSSRFLEELSRRYKKQSEDMMKMLNKTVAQLHNVTVEADVKSKLHEDEMTELEARLQNLTKIVNKLTHSFDNLNQQVTDRQMIWTTIEMGIIIIIVTFLYFRRKQVAVPPDVRALIEAMPVKPETPLKPRRNSLSGPPTPMKEKSLSALHEQGGLQRYRSETALGTARHDYTNTQSTDVINRQGSDGVKKKKKKKNKGSDLKLFTNPSVPFHSETGTTTLRTNFSQHSVVSDTQSTKIMTQSEVINSANLGQCSKSTKSCFGSLLGGWNGKSDKTRSASFDDRIPSDDFLANGNEKRHSADLVILDSAKNNFGAKNGMKGTNKKPPLPTGSKQSPKLNVKSSKNVEKVTQGNSMTMNKNSIELEEKWIKKGHRRQKSLPKDYAAVETIGPSFKKTKFSEPVGKLKHESKSCPTKLSKKEESSMNGSDTTRPSSKCYDCRKVLLNEELLDSDQMTQCYSLDRSQSDIYLTSSYGRCTGTEAYSSNSLNGHYKGASSYDDIGPTDVFTQNGADLSEHDDYIDGNLLNANTGCAPSNRKWKNVFNFFH